MSIKHKPSTLGTTIMVYDDDGNLAWSRPGSNRTSTVNCNNGDDGGSIPVVPVGERTIREYDPRNRIKTLSFPLDDDRGYTTYDYFPDGKLEAISSTSGDIYTRIDYEYNRRRLLTREDPVYRIVNTGIVYYPVVYNYNSNGHLSSQSWPGMPGLNSVDYAPNALGQPTKAGNFATGVSYHPNGAVAQFTYGNGIGHTLTQNTRGLPDTSTDAGNGTKFLDDGYDYDGNGNVLAISDGATGENQRGNRDMEYDGLNRLTKVRSPMYGSPPNNGTARYGYDELDNLRTASISGGPAPRDHLYHYDENNTWWLTSVTLENCDTGDTQGDLIFSDRFQGGCNGTPETNFYYDTRGNLSHRNNITYDFDLGNRLRKVEELRTSRYEYDGHGRRVSDSISGNGGGTRYSFYTADGRLSYAADDRRGVLSLYVYLGNSLVAVSERDAGGIVTNRYQHTDALGSPVVVTDQSGQVVTRYQYEPYGQVHDRIPYATPPDGPGYTGHLFDDVTGLNYMQQRYYDPGIGRFISADPVGANPETGANFNRYWYANNNPYKFIDPDGRYTSCADYSDAGNAGPCAEIADVTGKNFDTLQGASEAAAPGLMRLQEESGSEYGIAYSQNDDGTFTPTVAVSGTPASPEGALDTVDMSPLLEGTHNPVGDAHTHPDDVSFARTVGKSLIGNDLPRLDRMTARYARAPGSTYTSFVYRRIGAGRGAADMAVGRLIPNPNLRPGSATHAVDQQVTPNVFQIRF